MQIAPLYFSSIKQLCDFLRSTGLQHYLLLGKKSILITRYSTEQIVLAERDYGATKVDSPEVWMEVCRYFDLPSPVVLN